MGKNCKTLDFLGGCNFRKDKNLAFCRTCDSQCGAHATVKPNVQAQETSSTYIGRTTIGG